jgi:hypothetical protein
VSEQVPVPDATAGARAVRVQTVFHVADDRQAQVIAAKMVDRAHEIANLPECECDVDVSIDRLQQGAAHPVGPGGGTASGRPADF